MILHILLCMYLAVYTIMDIRNREIWWPLSPVMALLALIFHIISPDLSVPECLLGLLPGIMLLGLSRLTRESIGSGDCVTVAVCGMAVGLRSVFHLFFLAMILAACWSVLILVRKRTRAFRETFPFIPFLLAAQIYMLTAG